MEVLKIENFSFFYAEEENKVLHDISINIEEGSFVVFCGPSGSGKTTLLRQLKREIQPAGKQIGNIFYYNQQLEDIPEERTAAEIGFVFQDPENQIVTSTVWHELAFSLENMGCPTPLIRKRVAEVVNFFGIEGWLHKGVHELSGGQKQLVNLASILVLKPKVLLLDEPTSQLDPIAAREFILMLDQINKEFSTTIILSEHRLNDVFPLADQVIGIDNGRIKYNGTPQQVIKEIDNSQDLDYFSFLPVIPRIFLQIEENKKSYSSVPLTVKEGKAWLSGKQIKCTEMSVIQNENHHKSIIECKDISFFYDKRQAAILNKLNLSVGKGDFLSIVGGNGAGKSTLLKVLAGLAYPQRGSVLYQGQNLKRWKSKTKYQEIGYLAQNPKSYFVHDVVEEELLLAAKQAGVQAPNELVDQWALRFNIKHLLKKHPYDCSGGELQKLALILTLVSNPKLLLIDEPTKGLDPNLKASFGELLKGLSKDGITIIMVTHDIEFAATYSSSCAMLFDGDITAEGKSVEFFRDNYFYTTPVNRLMGDVLPNAINEEDVLTEWENSKKYY